MKGQELILLAEMGRFFMPNTVLTGGDICPLKVVSYPQVNSELIKPSPMEQAGMNLFLCSFGEGFVISMEGV